MLLLLFLYFNICFGKYPENSRVSLSGVHAVTMCNDAAANYSSNRVNTKVSV